ncbi:fructose-bisphosphate aldolase-like [Agrilus planipennis]|uniref:Fructose-bisphosphate aldolase n=1 Tax=Agrilus planipennis TaxID=224129 RepID=A0A1W4XTV7_AGRPL|nr:fructose-bisphosphate aldolase-like [Agrilus planipennis]
MVHFDYPPQALQGELRRIANDLMAPGKGILAADESLDLMEKRLRDIGLKNDIENRRRYRQILFTANKSSMGNYISGVIMLPATLYEKADNGTPFIELLKERGILPGVNVDGGLVDLPFTNGETITQGLDNLGQRLAEYKKAGCAFAKWRGAYRISKTTPSDLAIIENANALARYASLCQSNGLVPIVEPDISRDGDHDLETNQKTTEVVLAAVYKALNDHHVFLEGTVLKPSMVTPGKDHKTWYSPQDIAKATVLAVSRTVPAAVPGIGFLSGGQTDQEATDNLNAINKFTGATKPWHLTFIFGRALQTPISTTWKGKDENVVAAQEEFLKLAKRNSLASLGKYNR